MVPVVVVVMVMVWTLVRVGVRDLANAKAHVRYELHPNNDHMKNGVKRSCRGGTVDNNNHTGAHERQNLRKGREG